MRLIDADKLYPDRMTNKGVAISQSQIAHAPTVDAVPMSVIEDIRAEIKDGLNACVDIIDNTKKGIYPQIYSDDQMEGRKITYEHCLQIIDKHDPLKAGKEQE